jgi:hypothetical protein
MFMMKKSILVITLGFVVIAALAVAGLAYAQDATPTTPTTPWGGRGAYGGGGMMGDLKWGGAYGGGMMSGYGRGAGTGPMHTYMVEAFAQALGLTVEDVQAQFDAGATMWQIASDQGLSDEEVQGVMIQARTAALNAMVADGVLTQEQADFMLERMNTMMAGDFTPGSCPMNNGAAGAGFRGGRGGGRWSQPTTP